MGKGSFEDILKQWDELQSKKEKKSPSPAASKPASDLVPRTVEKKPQQSFAQILDQWEKDHDQDKDMKRRAQGSAPRASEKTLNQIRRMEPQAELDLHEYTLEEARRLVREFIDSCYAKGFRKVRIITGKGIHSKGGEAVLRPAITAEVQANCHVREVFTPKAAEGGSGALSVLLKGR